MTLRLLALLAATFVVTALAVPPSASAKPVRYVSYQVTVEGDADYVRADDTQDSQRDEHASFSWRTVFPHVLFRNDEVDVGHPGNTGPPTTGTLHTAQSTAVTRGGTYSCSATAFSLMQSGRFLATPYVPGTDPVIKMHTLGGALPNFDGCPAQAIVSFDLLGKFAEGGHTYQTEFTFPREAIGMGRVIQLVDEEYTDRRCPNNVAGTSDVCRLEFDATITFDEKEDYVIDDGTPIEIGEEDVPDPPVVIGEQDIPDPPVRIGEDDIPSPPGPLDDVFIPIPPGAGRLSPSAATATVPVTCAADCKGTVTATAAGAKPRAAASRVLARKTFKARAGRAKPVTLRFKPAARRAIRRAGGVRLTIAASAPGRGTTRRTVTLRLKK